MNRKNTTPRGVGRPKGPPPLYVTLSLSPEEARRLEEWAQANSFGRAMPRATAARELMLAAIRMGFHIKAGT
jgi:hypothetical protein